MDYASFVRGISAKIFRDMGFAEVLEAENGVQAISILNKQEVDLLVTDIQMPEMNGEELIKSAKAMCSSDTSFVVITGGISDDILKRLSQIEAHQHHE